ncbi:MAG: hypothetical protein ACTSPY_04695 [Candidatus Helarchaeota archaeon]
MSIILDNIPIRKMETECIHLDTTIGILNYFLCKKRKYHVNPEKFCKLCPYYE